MLKDGNGPHHLQGQGRYHVNPSLAIVSSSGNKGCGVEDFNFPGGHRLFFLERNDMGKDFEYAGEGHNQTCHSRNTTGSMQVQKSRFFHDSSKFNHSLGSLALDHHCHVRRKVMIEMLIFDLRC